MTCEGAIPGDIVKCPRHPEGCPRDAADIARLDREQALRIADGDEGLQRLLEATLELNRRISTVHERQDCPTCWAPRNVRCRAMPKGYVVGRTGRVGGRELKHALTLR